MKGSFLVVLCLVAAQLAFGQKNNKLNVYWVSFRDKAGTPYSVLEPEKYLSARALERREQQGIRIDFSDLPVTPGYTEAVRNAGGVIHFTSRWLNGALVYIEGPEILDKVEALSFVTSTEPVGVHRDPSEPKEPKKRKDKDYRKTESYYGDAFNQINMLNGISVHEAGFRGKRIVAAVFDGGFRSLPDMCVMDSLFLNNKILGTHDFVEGDDFVFEDAIHGSNVISCMAANIPNLMVGTGPDASYYLFKTEDDRAEMVIEEYNWLAAAEMSDSLGVDVINSSLGYTEFDDTTQNHKHEGLNGDLYVATRAADLAASKGILVVNSAGNEGLADWKYIGVPADADSILCVAAVDRGGDRAYFSSLGRKEDPRILPNVAARGASAVIAAPSGYATSTSSGTSFSSPITAGMACALWDAFPDKTNMDVIRAIERAGSQYDKPDDLLGFGIPDYRAAFSDLSGGAAILPDEEPYQIKSRIAPDLSGIFLSGKDETISISLTGPRGEPLGTGEVVVKKYSPAFFRFDTKGMSAGIYVVRLQTLKQIRYIAIAKA